MQLPLHEISEGPSVLRAQILLDRVFFSPGIIDGRWGKNTEKAVYWFQYREGLRKTGRVDQPTFDRLAQMAAAGTNLVEARQLTADDVSGPFAAVPEDIYEKEKLDCLCYESLTEKLAELFHTSPDVLGKLNPGVDLDAVTAGQTLNVPNVREADAGRGAQVARLVVSSEGFFVHALDASGRILFHFPTTLGSSFDPSPSGNHSVVRITRDPVWHYQPALLAHVDDSERDAQIPAGPNNAVGLVWMALSIEHYGIHGTSAPETIGYVTSAGCIRLTNWDALFLADRIAVGVPVEFRAGGAIAMVN
jgi:lipoprotein-anchoring transpeptidase ErfK/SrfK